MPKQIYKIDQFHGGLNNSADPRDISDDQLAAATDCDVSNVGTIKAPYGIAVKQYGTEENVSVDAGSEILHFNGSYSGGHDKAAPVAADTNYLVIGDNDNSRQVQIHESGDDAWSGSSVTIDVGDGTSANPAFYYVDGALRVSSTNHAMNISNQNLTRWYGPIPSLKKFILSSDETTASFTENLWKIGVAEPQAPTDGSSYNGGADANWSVDTAANYPNAAQKVNFCFRLTSALKTSGEGFSDGTEIYKWGVAASFEYDGKQEGPLRIIDTDAEVFDGTSATLTSSVAMAVRCYVRADQTGGGYVWDPRITAINLYMKQEHVDSEWYHAVKFDTTIGATLSTAGQAGASYWARAGTGDDITSGNEEYLYSEAHLHLPQKFITYEANSGLPVQEHTRDICFKTAVVANRRVYLGNVVYKNSQKQYVTREDAIVYSNINQFDTFDVSEPGGNILETSTGDGDSIVKLLVFNDRLLEFKQSKVTVINIGQATPFIEQRLSHNGILNKAAAFQTDLGIAWANDSGCWFYDGQQITNLIEKNGLPLISQSTWASHVSGAPAVFYIPKERKIGVLDDTTSSGNGHIYIFDMVLQSWTYLRSVTNGNTATSWIINEDGDPMFYDVGESADHLKVWTQTRVAGDNFDLRTKDIDFGAPGVRKKVYKVYVSYKGDGSAVTVQYGINGETDAYSDLLPFYRTNADGSSDGTNSDTTPLLDDNDKEHWITAELKPVSSINNIYSFQLLFAGTAATDFEINDISIVYRMKSIK